MSPAIPLAGVPTPEFLQYCSARWGVEFNFQFPGAEWEAHMCWGVHQWLPLAVLVAIALVALGYWWGRSKRV